MKILVTGAAGFIGAAVCRRLLERGDSVTGIDNINSYYDPVLKYARLALLGIDRAAVKPHMPVASTRYDDFIFARIDLEEREALETLFLNQRFDVVINLAAQAGVRYSLQNPGAYIHTNVNGFNNILECCRHNGVSHLVYASSSSVYGLNGKVPFSEHDSIAHPVSLYAATKKCNELMAHVYSHLYDLPTTGLRFFTVYGPWGRPDMSPFLFIDAILHDRPIKVFNNGNMLRDFTYIDDIVEGVVRIADVIPGPSTKWNELSPDPAASSAPYRIYNIGNQHPTRLMDYITCIETAIGRPAKKQFMEMQPGDVYQTYADSSALAEATGFRPATDLQEGINRTVAWFKQYYNLA